RAEFALFSGIRFLDEGRIFLAEERFMCASKGLGEKQNFLQSVLLMQKSNVHLVHDEIDESRKSVGLMTRINRTHADPWMPYVSYWWSAQLELMLGNLGKGLQILHELAEGMRIFTQGSLP